MTYHDNYSLQKKAKMTKEKKKGTEVHCMENI